MKNPCYDCDIHLTKICKNRNEQCENCKKRFEYLKSIQNSYYIQYPDYDDGSITHDIAI